MSDKHSRLRDYFPSQPHFITPDNREFHRLGKYAVETSEGAGFTLDRAPIYGVTVVRLDTGDLVQELSKCFLALDKRDAYLRELESL